MLYEYIGRGTLAVIGRVKAEVTGWVGVGAAVEFGESMPSTIVPGGAVGEATTVGLGSGLISSVGVDVRVRASVRVAVGVATISAGADGTAVGPFFAPGEASALVLVLPIVFADTGVEVRSLETGCVTASAGRGATGSG